MWDKTQTTWGGAHIDVFIIFIIYIYIYNNFKAKLQIKDKKERKNVTLTEAWDPSVRDSNAPWRSDSLSFWPTGGRMNKDVSSFGPCLGFWRTILFLHTIETKININSLDRLLSEICSNFIMFNEISICWLLLTSNKYGNRTDLH